MKTLFKNATCIGALVLSAVFSGGAMAYTPPEDLGLVTGTKLFSAITNGNFDTLYHFSVSNNIKTAALVTSLGTISNNAQVTLVSMYLGDFDTTGMLQGETPLALVLNPVSTPVEGTDLTLHLYTAVSNDLEPGNIYTLRVQGTGVGESAYSGNITISPVPEPETYAMMLAGLGMMAAIARRRRSNG